MRTLSLQLPCLTRGDLIDVVVKRVKRERAEQAVVILERRDEELTMFVLNIMIIRSIKNHGVLDVSLQAER